MGESTTRKIPQCALMVVGLTTIILAALGLWSNYSTLILDYSVTLEGFGQKADLSKFYVMFYRMSAICAVLYLLLLVTGVQLIRKKINWPFVLLAVVVLEVVYVLAVGWLWAHSPNAASIAAASGISSGGLMYQGYVAFPIWGPALTLWARHRMLAPVVSSDL